MDLTPKKPSAPWQWTFFGCCRGSDQQSATGSRPSCGCDDDDSTSASISDASAPEVGATAYASAACREASGGELTATMPSGRKSPGSFSRTLCHTTDPQDAPVESKGNCFADQTGVTMREASVFLTEESRSSAGLGFVDGGVKIHDRHGESGNGGSIETGTSDDAAGDEDCHRYANSIGIDEDNDFRLSKVGTNEKFTVDAGQASRCTDSNTTKRVKESTHQLQLDLTFYQLTIVALLSKLFGEYVFGPQLTLRPELMKLDEKLQPVESAASEANHNASDSKEEFSQITRTDKSWDEMPTMD